MVQLKYKGLSTLYVGGYALKAGFNEMKDVDFYKLMQTKTFRFRVEQKILEVPLGFALHKPTAIKNPVVTTEATPEKVVDHIEKDEENANATSVKPTLKLIEKSTDREYLQNLIYKDQRPRVVDEAKKRLKSLKH
jgi:hypothetical protein